jgi:alkylation response protein AidB-like acyl-CoA dehydrogenase
MRRRTVFTPEHEAFRETVRGFFARELVPNAGKFEKDGHVSREFYRKAGAHGLVSPFIAEEYGGPGGDFLHFLIVCEEMGTCPAGSVIGPSLEYGLVAYHIVNFGTEAQKRQWLPAICRGEALISLGMTEPDSGSDLQSMKTVAIRHGDHFVVNGAKTYISNAIGADLMVLAAKTDPTAAGRGITLFLVDTRSEGFKRGRLLGKMGMQAADTSEIFFQDMVVPADAILGGEGKGFTVMMSELPKERLTIASRAVAEAQTALDLTLEFVKTRCAFGQTVYDFQNTQFKLAEMETEISVGRAFVDQCIADYTLGEFDNRRTAMSKLWCTEMAGRVIDTCVQLHGGAGYMSDYWISKIYTATRIRRIFGGTSEIMKKLIAKGM